MGLRRGRTRVGGEAEGRGVGDIRSFDDPPPLRVDWRRRGGPRLARGGSGSGERRSRGGPFQAPLLGLLLLLLLGRRRGRGREKGRAVVASMASRGTVFARRSIRALDSRVLGALAVDTAQPSADNEELGFVHPSSEILFEVNRSWKPLRRRDIDENRDATGCHSRLVEEDRLEGHDLPNVLQLGFEKAPRALLIEPPFNPTLDDVCVRRVVKTERRDDYTFEL